jgi:putative transcriptional regulator
MKNESEPTVRSLLVSEPFMLDSNFVRSVVLLGEHGPGGSIGWVLNQPSNLILSDVMPDVPKGNFRLFIGGPVGQDSIQFVHKCYDRLDSGIDLGDGVYWGGNFEVLRVLIDSGAIQPDEIKFFLGYSGWTEGQLKQEITENTWMVSNSFHKDLIFVDDEENLWKEAVVNLGPKYAHVAQFPKNPSLN